MNLKSIPNWLMALAMAVLVIIYAYSLLTGNLITFWGKEFGVKHSGQKEDGIPNTTQTWTIKGGIYNDWTGQWQVNDRPEGFECIKPYGYSTYMANCSAIFSENRVAVRTYTVEDGNVCLYFGTKTGNRISGEMLCKDNYELYSWSAIILE